MDRLVFVSVIEGCIMIQWILKWIFVEAPAIHDCIKLFYPTNYRTFYVLLPDRI